MTLGLVKRYSVSNPTIILPVLRGLLPRPRVPRLILETLFFRGRPLPENPPVRLPMGNPQVVYQSMIRTFLNGYKELEDVCRNGDCGRRGCYNKAGSRCSRCRETGYCSADCQKL